VTRIMQILVASGKPTTGEKAGDWDLPLITRD